MQRSGKAPLSVIAESWIVLDGQPFRLDDWPMHRAFYDGRFQHTLFKTSRQVAKSTTLANFAIIECSLIPHFSTMFVSPSKEQTTRFSNTRVGKTMRYSPIINNEFLKTDLADRVFHKQFTNGSEMLFTYANDDAERLRGPSTDRNCYDRNAQVLTKKGWVRVSDVTLKDVLADVNDDGIIEWHNVTDVIRKKHTGTMVTFNHRGFKLRVTGDHKVWINYNVKPYRGNTQADKYAFTPAIEAARTSKMGFKMTCAAKWSRQAPPYRIFKGTKKVKRREREFLKLPYKEFARLVGWYIAEGHLLRRNYGTEHSTLRPVITQKAAERGYFDIVRCLDACGLHYIESKTDVCQFTICSQSLGHYFARLGKSRNKQIPREFFRYPELLKEVLKGLYLGDASYHEGEDWDHGTLRTRSKHLAENVQEAWLRLERPAPIHLRQMRGEPLYEVCPYKHDYFIFWRADFERKQRVIVEQVKDEEVYCFTIPHHRPLVKGDFSSLPCISSQCFDEVQDVLYDPVITVGNETMANSDYAYEMYAGTPKTMENTIQYLWENSTQTEWVMRCEHCGKLVFIDNEQAVGRKGPICVHCGGCLNPYKGQWVDMAPDKSLQGFHISQLIMPINVPYAVRSAGRSTAMVEQAERRWQRIIRKFEDPNSTLSVFRNEVLGVSDEIGTRLISQEELEALCTGKALVQFPEQSDLQGYTQIVAGADWSGGGTSGVSRTVLWIWGWRPTDQKLVCLFYKIYPSTNPVAVVDEIGEICKQFRVSLFCGDAGEGALPNDTMRQHLGHHRVIQVQYGTQAKALKFNQVDRYTADRTTLIDNYMMLLKQKKLEFGPLSAMRTAINDILNEYEDITQNERKVWRHSPQKPDDALHAGLFGWIAWKVINKDLRFWQE